MDKRIKKSKKAIEQALIQLMAEKNFEAITINAIAERADVNRGTIYLHYNDKYDLLEQCIARELHELVTFCFSEDTEKFPSKEPLILTFRYLEQHAFTYQTLLNSQGIPAFRNELSRVILRGVQSHIKSKDSKQQTKNDILVQFWSSAIIGVLEWWIIESMPCTPEEVTEQLWALLKQNQIVSE